MEKCATHSIRTKENVCPTCASIIASCYLCGIYDYANRTHRDFYRRDFRYTPDIQRATRRFLHLYDWPHRNSFGWGIDSNNHFFIPKKLVETATFEHERNARLAEKRCQPDFDHGNHFGAMYFYHERN